MKNRFTCFAAVTAAAAVLTSCGGRNIAENEVKKTVVGFFDAAKSGDAAVIDKYIENELAADYVEKALGLEGLFDSMLGDTSELIDSDAMKDITAAALGEVAERITYNVDNIEMIDNDNAKVSVTFEMPDFENADLSFENVFAMASDVLGVDVSDEHQLARLIMERTGLSTEELKAMYADITSSGSADQLISAFEPEVIEMIRRMVDSMSSGSATESSVLDMHKQDGKWRIANVQ